MTEATQWEYRLESFGTYWTSPKEDLLQATLDEWGEQGWEIISVLKGSSGEKVTLVAKRPLTRVTRRKRDWPG
jgi:hypothetical protein